MVGGRRWLAARAGRRRARWGVLPWLTAPGDDERGRAAWRLQRPRRTPAVKLRALRGAITVAANDSDSILEGTDELVREVMSRNDLEPADMVSCIFTCTADLDAEFPAVAARRLGLSGVPLLCTREIDVPGSLPRGDPANAALLRRSGYSRAPRLPARSGAVAP